MNGLTVFYLNPEEKYQRVEHSYPLVPGLTPIVYVRNEELILLGKPYTSKFKFNSFYFFSYLLKACKKDSSYSVSFCDVEELLKRIHAYCQCIPSYMAEQSDFPWMANASECTFNHGLKLIYYYCDTH